MPTTPNFGWTLPTVGGDVGSWGTTLNNAFNSVDSQMKTTNDTANTANTTANTANTTANAALPKAGGTMTGNLSVKTTGVQSQSFASASGTVTINCATSNYAEITSTTANVTIALSNVATNAVYTLTILVTTSGAHTVTWPASVKWSGGTAPAQTASGTDIYQLITNNSGTTFYGARVIRAAA